MLYEEIYDNDGEIADILLVKDRRNANRRHKDYAKAVRKRDICRKVYGHEWYDNLHQYADNKVHCSCWMCAFHGPSYSDMKKMERSRQELEEV